MRRIPLVINGRQGFETSDPHSVPGGGPGPGGGPPGSVVTSLTVQFRDLSDPTPSSWDWTFIRSDSVVLGTSTQQNPSFTFPQAGVYTVTLVTNLGTATQIVTVLGTVPPGGNNGGDGTGNWTPVSVESLPRPTTFDYTVGVDGTLQHIVDTQVLTNKVILVPAGTHTDSIILTKTNFNFAGLRIYLDAGAILDGDQGFILYGQILDLRVDGPGIIQVDGSNVVGEGFYVDANRTDMGANGNAAGRIIVDGVEVRPRPGTGSIQRNGINIWGADLFQITNTHVHHAAGNAAFGFGGAGSGISCGKAKRLAASGTIRALIAANKVHDMFQTADGDSADRNGIILDLFHSEGGSLHSDYLIGDVVIDSNEVYDVDGRGIQILRAGLTDSRIIVTNNFVHGVFGQHLGQFGGPEVSEPVCGIGGYGAGMHGNVVCSNNTVSTPPAGVAAYKFLSFDGAVTPAGVTGSGNSGTPVVFSASATDSAPAGFASSGGGGLGYLDPPIAAAISGLSLSTEWDFTVGPASQGWYLYDGTGNANGERSVPRAANAEIVAATGTTGGSFLRLWCKRENYLGNLYTGVQMEAPAVTVGNGSPFYVEVRLRWTGYVGFWGGPWLLQYPGTPHEIDVMETVNHRPPWTTSHSPSIATQAYAASNDGEWHRYGIRVDNSGLIWYFDNVQVLSLANPTISAQFVSAAMFPKIQHLCGGTFPDSDAGFMTPVDADPFPDRAFDIDYYRLYT